MTQRVPEHSHVTSAEPTHPHRGQAFAIHDGYRIHTHDEDGHPVEPKAKLDFEGVVTARQREVLAFSAEGMTAREIGEVMGLTKTTVRTHRFNALRRLKARNTAHAVAILLRRGEIL